ncbi:XTP/dITP diphosphatase [Candidatus Methanoliparum sp. LAM-1]|uniref:XTP/dITP diphosphatase n=1 Tax=Candidatus Methanoliparum sp. LAM-1 TaxID=2874846 RepID=UPI001E2859B7|nr:XTP/dITP diphosphatase [Candidatus Methanoliparum sp. LAM-1]BDC36583.1 non-canonical purine NTP pyrophosphatase [Candidatus Methanoliparum sp. LAM-1]
MSRLRFVTSNKEKFYEVKHLLSDYDIEMFNVGYPEIQASDLEDVAYYGITYLWNNYGGDIFLEDSGLFIHKLNGFPGVFSSYVHDTIGNKGILRLLSGEKDRRAYFKSVISYCNKKGDIKLFSGRVDGFIFHEERGKNGFGFDPIFLYNGRTFGEISLDEKNKKSHRGSAVSKFKKFLENNFKEVL